MLLSRLTGVAVGFLVFFIYLIIFRKPISVLSPKPLEMLKDKLKSLSTSSNVWEEKSSETAKLETSVIYYMKLLKCHASHAKLNNESLTNQYTAQSSIPDESIGRNSENFNLQSSHQQYEESTPPQQPERSQKLRSDHYSRSVEIPLTLKQTRCAEWKDTYHVVPGASWGTLPVTLQKEWSNQQCDQVLETSIEQQSKSELTIRTSNTVAPRQNSMIAAAAAQSFGDGVGSSTTTNVGQFDMHHTKEKETGLLHKLENDRKNRVKGDTAGLPRISKKSIDWCFEAREKFKVIPMKSWGQLPMNLIDSWKTRQCDLAFTAVRMSHNPLATCAGKNMSSKIFKSLPLISIMAASTTRKVREPSTDNLALFTFMLPSLIRTIDCGYRYEYVLGFDKGDPFYDSDEGMTIVRKWFKANVELPLKANGISMTLRVVKVNNTIKKPGPVFLEMARAAYQSGASYFYRVNDDTEMKHHWPSIFVASLQSLRKPYGVVGPKCEQGNQNILTHDFVTRLHMDIFEMNYYPPQLVDWWMDDWISYVYGQKRTFKAQNVQVIHHTGAHGQRYEVDRNNESLLKKLIDEGRQKIRKWMLMNQVSEHELKEFDTDIYEPGYQHFDVQFRLDSSTGEIVNVHSSTHTSTSVSVSNQAATKTSDHSASAVVNLGSGSISSSSSNQNENKKATSLEDNTLQKSESTSDMNHILALGIQQDSVSASTTVSLLESENLVTEDVGSGKPKRRKRKRQKARQPDSSESIE